MKTDARVLIAATVSAVVALAVPWAILLVLAALVTALWLLSRKPERRHLLWGAVAVSALSLALMVAITMTVGAAGA